MAEPEVEAASEKKIPRQQFPGSVFLNRCGQRGRETLRNRFREFH
jgi:hypothetical protein